jgi:hypothetical protein
MEENGEMEFPAFPYKPYSIQIDFMKALYQSLEKGGIAMLESPTGNLNFILMYFLSWVYLYFGNWFVVASMCPFTRAIDVLQHEYMCSFIS